MKFLESAAIPVPRNEGMGGDPRLVAVSCNLCGADDAAVVFRSGEAQYHRVVRCRRCGLMYANPRAAVPEHALLRNRDPDEPSWRTFAAPRLEKERLQVRDFASTRRALGRAFPGRGRLLEIGSGFGCLLGACRDDGWDVLGIDPFEGFCRHAREEYGVETLATILEDAALPAQAFNVVLMLHVIEHLHDPLGTLREVHRVLAPGGRLVIETPRYDSLAFRILGRRERSVSCDAHLFFYTDRTLRETAARAGFRYVTRARVGRSLSLSRVLWNLGVMSKSPRVRRALVGFGRRCGCDRLRLHVNLGDMVRMVLGK